MNLELGHYAPDRYFDREARRVIGTVDTVQGETFQLVQRALPVINHGPSDWSNMIIRERLILSLGRGLRDPDAAPFFVLGEEGADVKLQGLYVPMHARQHGLAHVLFGVAHQLTQIIRKKVLEKTGPIHKPEVPGFLAKYGFVPTPQQYNRIRVIGDDITPGNDEHPTPIIQVVSRAPSCPLIQRLGEHIFFRIAGPNDFGEMEDGLLDTIPITPLSVSFYVKNRESYRETCDLHKADFELTLRKGTLLLGTDHEREVAEARRRQQAKSKRRK